MDCMIIGLKRCGKTTLAKALSSHLKPNLVYDPMLSNDWDTQYKTANFSEFVKVAEANRSCYLFIDECFTLSDKEDKRKLTNLMAFGRHYGHTLIMIGQRYTAIPKTARELCERLFVFKQSPDDMKEIRGNYPWPEVEHLPTLERGEYLDLTAFSCERRKIF